MLSVDGASAPVSSAPQPEHRSDSTECQLNHAHRIKRRPASTNYEGIEKLDQTVSTLLYILAVPERAVRLGLCHSIAGWAGDGGP
jgi:hypothetical protein